MEFVASGIRFEDGRIADPTIAAAVERILQSGSAATAAKAFA